MYLRPVAHRYAMALPGPSPPIAKPPLLQTDDKYTSVDSFANCALARFPDTTAGQWEGMGDGGEDGRGRNGIAQGVVSKQTNRTSPSARRREVSFGTMLATPLHHPPFPLGPDGGQSKTVKSLRQNKLRSGQEVWFFYWFP